MECCIFYSLSLSSSVILQLSGCSFPLPLHFTSSGMRSSIYQQYLYVLRSPEEMFSRPTPSRDERLIWPSWRWATSTSCLQVFSLGLLVTISQEHNSTYVLIAVFFDQNYLLFVTYHLHSLQGHIVFLSIPLADRYNLHKEFMKCLFKRTQFHIHNLWNTFATNISSNQEFSFSPRKTNPRA